MYKDIAQNVDIFVIEYPKTIVPNPTENDYNALFINRYFVRKANDLSSHIFEVDKSTFDEYKANPFWLGENLRWRITGPIDAVYNSAGNIDDKGVLDSNKSSIYIASKILPNIKLYLPNLLQFYRK